MFFENMLICLLKTKIATYVLVGVAKENYFFLLSCRAAVLDQKDNHLPSATYKKHIQYYETENCKSRREHYHY